MAKGNLPRIDDAPVKQEQPQQQETRKEPAPAGNGSYREQLAAFRNVNANLPREHQVLMRDTLRHLQDVGETLNDGTEVTDKTKAVLWLLENANLV